MPTYRIFATISYTNNSNTTYANVFDSEDIVRVPPGFDSKEAEELLSDDDFRECLEDIGLNFDDFVPIDLSHVKDMPWSIGLDEGTGAGSGIFSATNDGTRINTLTTGLTVDEGAVPPLLVPEFPIDTLLLWDFDEPDKVLASNDSSNPIEDINGFDGTKAGGVSGTVRILNQQLRLEGTSSVILPNSDGSYVDELENGIRIDFKLEFVFGAQGNEFEFIFRNLNNSNRINGTVVNGRGNDGNFSVTFKGSTSQTNISNSIEFKNNTVYDVSLVWTNDGTLTIKRVDTTNGDTNIGTSQISESFSLDDEWELEFTNNAQRLVVDTFGITDSATLGNIAEPN